MIAWPTQWRKILELIPLTLALYAIAWREERVRGFKRRPHEYQRLRQLHKYQRVFRRSHRAVQ